MQAQSLIFFNAQDLTFGGRKRIQSNSNLHILHLGFLGLGSPLVTLCVCAAGAWPCSCINNALPPFMSRSTFVISQVEQHDPELFKAACIFCIKKNEKERKKQRDKRLFNNVC